jgi:hypothetical protein
MILPVTILEREKQTGRRRAYDDYEAMTLTTLTLGCQSGTEYASRRRNNAFFQDNSGDSEHIYTSEGTWNTYVVTVSISKWSSQPEAETRNQLRGGKAAVLVRSPGIFYAVRWQLTQVDGGICSQQMRYVETYAEKYARFRTHEILPSS